MKGLSYLLVFSLLSCGQYESREETIDKNYLIFETTCRKLCSPDEFHIVGRPMPGRVSEDTKCLCGGQRPRFVAKWR
jgi:hypothetical protein